MISIQRMMDHMYWANEQLFASLQENPKVSKDVIKLLNHIIAAEQIWLHRLDGRTEATKELWAEAELKELGEFSQHLVKDYQRYIRELNEDKLDTMISYRNRTGAPFINSVRDILIHVAMHGQYHRAQINRSIKEQTYNPISVDFITFARRGIY